MLEETNNDNRKNHRIHKRYTWIFIRNAFCTEIKEENKMQILLEDKSFAEKIAHVDAADCVASMW